MDCGKKFRYKMSTAMCICQDLIRKQHTQTESLEDSLIKKQSNNKTTTYKVCTEHQGWCRTMAPAPCPWSRPKGQEISSFQNLEREAVWGGPPSGPRGVDGPPSLPPSFWSSARTSHSESKQSQRQARPLTKSIWAQGEQWLCRDKWKISSTLCYF